MNKMVTEKTISQVIIDAQDQGEILANIVLPLEQVVTKLSGDNKETLDQVLSWGAFGAQNSD